MLELLVARSRQFRAVRHRDQGRLDAAERLSQRAIVGFQRCRGTAGDELALSCLTLASIHAERAAHTPAERWRRRAITLLEPRSALLADALVALGDGLRRQARYQEAEAVLLRAAETGWAVAAVQNALGILCKDTGRYEQAAAHYAACGEALGDRADPAAIANQRHNLAGLAYARGDYADAEQLARAALALRARALGADAPATVADAVVLAAVLAALGRPAQAAALYRCALRIYRRRYGPDHYEVAVCVHGLAALPDTAAQESRYLFDRALRVKRAVLGEEHPEIAVLLHNLAALQARTGRHEEAARHSAEAVGILIRTLGPDHPVTRRCEAAGVGWRGY